MEQLLEVIAQLRETIAKLEKTRISDMNGEELDEYAKKIFGKERPLRD